MNDSYPPIRDYAVIGDCRSAALVSLQGSIDWCCWPRFDSPAVFARLLDWERGGHFVIQPAIPFHSTRGYVERTNVLMTTFHTAGGRVVLTDFMPAMTDLQKRERLLPSREIVRRLDGIEGEVPMRVEFVPRPDFAAAEPRVELHDRHRVSCRHADELLQLGADVPLDVHGAAASSQFTLRAGEAARFNLTYTNEAPEVRPALGSVADEKLTLSLDYWARWLNHLDYVGPHREAVERSALLLKLFLYAPSGAIVAAPTTSLPEAIGGVRNWDYRYCWLRDASFTSRALFRLGFRRDGDAYCGWLLHATAITHPGLRVLYDVHGHPKVPERTLDHFRGYRGSGPVRIGNAASDQFQLDIYGELLSALEHEFEHGQDLDSHTRRLACAIGELITRQWEQPDHGIWEIRSGTFQHVHGKVQAWAALDTLVRLAEKGVISGDRATWEQARAAIRHRILNDGYNDRLGTFVATLGGDRLDASLLTMPVDGFLPADDRRVRATTRAIREKLGVDDLIYRYRGIDDGLPGDEGAFLACSFWLVSNLALAGEIDDAQSVFHHVIRLANDVGLYSEEIDPRSGAFLGNFPQGLTHIALINAALAIQQHQQGKKAFRKAQTG